MKTNLFIVVIVATAYATIYSEFAKAQRLGKLDATRHYNPELDVAWETWKTDNDKNYEDALDEDERYLM